MINPEKNFQNARDEFKPAPRTWSQANGSATRSTAVGFMDDSNTNDPDHSFHLANLRLSLVGSVESFETVKEKESGEKVSNPRKAFEAPQNFEEIFQQHIPDPLVKKASLPSSEARLVDVHRETNQGLGISIVGEL